MRGEVAKLNGINGFREKKKQKHNSLICLKDEINLKLLKLSSGSFVLLFVSTSRRWSCRRHDAVKCDEVLSQGGGLLVVRLTGQGGIFWVGSTEPRANLNSGNNEREEGGSTISQTQTAQDLWALWDLGGGGGALSLLLFLCGPRSATMQCRRQVHSASFAGRMSLVCRRAE